MTSLSLLPRFEIPFVIVNKSKVTTRTDIPFSVKVAPFDSGTWQMYHTGGIPHTVGIEWSNVDSSVTNLSLTLSVYEATDLVHSFTYTVPEDWSKSGRAESVFTTKPSQYANHYNNYGQSIPQRNYTLRIEWTCAAWAIGGPRDFAIVHSDLLKTHHINDVRLVFPRNRSLWASQAVLCAASPYFRTSFKSGFSESSDRATAESTSPMLGLCEALECDDSDDDERSNSSYSSAASKSQTPNSSHPTIQIYDTSYITYHAVLCWIYTTYIDFAPLLSTFDTTSSDKARAGRDLHLAKFISTNPKLPTPASPKSIYRLAHYLELPKLKNLALANIKSQLSPSNIAVELFSETSGRYDEVLDVMVEYAAAHTTEMKASAGWKATMAKLAEMKWAATVFAKLAEKVL